MSTQPIQGHLSRQQPRLALWRPQPYHMRKGGSSDVHRHARHSQHAFASALLLVRHEDHAVVDRQSLRGLGIRSIRVITSGAEAARILCGRQRIADSLPFPDFVLCDDQLADMTGLEFLALLRSHPKLASFPVIMALNRDTPAVHRTLEAHAASGVAFRPYSGDTMSNQLARAAAMNPPKQDRRAWLATDEETNSFDLALSRFALARKVSEQAAGQWYREGLLCLKQGQWESAAVAFQQALKDQVGHADAAQGLAVALRKRQEQIEASGHKRLSKQQADALREDLLLASQSANPEAAIKMVIAALDEADPVPALGTDSSVALEQISLSSETTEKTPFSVPADRKNRAGASVNPTEKGRPIQPGSSAIALLPDSSDAADSGLICRFPLLRDAVNVVKITRSLYKGHKK